MVRRYSGYDEYEGVFGPLGSYAASSGPRRSHQRNWTLDAGAQSERERFLAERRAKRRLRAFAIENESEVDSGHENDGVEPLALKPQVPETQAPQRQVWLPTRNFSFRQRAGKLDTRAIARLDLERIVATTDIDAIQRHLENLAFADVTIDDVQHYSDAYFLKLFQIAQLTLEYLLNVQDSLVSHSETIETQCEQLLEECRQLESENCTFEAEIAGLKKDIRHKQRTMATFEVMLLNASVSQRRNSAATRAPPGIIDKENAAAEANAIVDSLLGSSGGASGAEEKEDGVVSQPVDCVVCGKKFLSVGYLLRHQQRKHQSERKTKKQDQKAKRAATPFQHSSSSPSSSDSSKKKTRERRVKTAPLPAEVAKALEEKNELAKQLIQLQEQLQQEKTARDTQAMALESQLTSQVAGSMSKLQEMLLAIERKQEMAKQDIMQYTQSTIARLQTEAASSLLLKSKTGASSSRAGKLESDEDEDSKDTKKLKGEADRGAGRQEAQLEKMLEVFFKAQIQQQQEIDALAQENSKLLSKRYKKKRHRQSVEPSSLMQMAALDAQRFGVDNGTLERETLASSASVRPVEKLAAQEDKLVQTDEEAKSSTSAALKTQEVQTDVDFVIPEIATPAPVPVAAVPKKKKEPPIRPNTVNEQKLAPPKPEKVEVTVSEVPQEKQEQEKVPLVLDEEPQTAHDKIQHAAHIVSKVALGFLTRKRLKNPVNWLITLSLTALETALSEEERSVLQGSAPDPTQKLEVEVESGMTANELRLKIARALSGRSDHVDDTDDALDSPSTGIDYHRVLLHHVETREELHGDRSVHALRNKIEVEIVPSYQAAEEHVDSVFAFHSALTNRLKDIGRASMQLVENSPKNLKEPQLRRLVRLQARVRGFLAKRRAAAIKIDRLVEMRILRMREAAVSMSRRRSTTPGEQAPAKRSSLPSNPLVAKQCQKVQERLSLAVKDKLKDRVQNSPASASNLNRISISTFAQQIQVLERERSKLPADVQERIRSLQTRLDHMVHAEYDPEYVRTLERRNEAAIKIQSVVNVVIARRRLQTLLARDRESRAEESDTGRRESGRQSPMSPLLSPLSEVSGDFELDSSSSKLLAGDHSERLDDFDDEEIEKLADAYEEGGGREQTASESKRSSHNGRGLQATSSVVVPPSTPTTSERPSTPPIAIAEKKPAVAVVARRSMPLPPKLTPAPSSEQQPRASTPIQQAAEASEPGRSPRPKLQDKEVISPFSKTPLLSRRSGSVTRRGTGYDNAR